MINVLSANDADAFGSAIDALPPLPSVIHYDDDYDDLVRSVKTSECFDSVTIHVSGSAVVIRFDRLDGIVRNLVRHYLLWNIQEMAPASIVYYYRHLSTVAGLDLKQLASADPLEAKAEWPSMSARYSSQTMAALKSLLGFCCKFSFMSWSPIYADFISYALNVANADPYGRTEEDRALGIKSHSFRHLQNAELFRLGVADTIITKRFNRRSVAQSYEYDHRSLAEELDQVSLPDEWELMIGESKAATVAKMIQVGRANGPIVREFKRIQAEEGDLAALQFLSAEADGFHATPYGTCLNSFTVDPCPKHLECFTGCRHLSATNLPEHQKNIMTLYGRLKVALESAAARPEGSVGRANQIAHASVRIAGVEKLLAALPGQAPFPDGQDLSLRTTRESVLHGS